MKTKHKAAPPYPPAAQKSVVNLHLLIFTPASIKELYLHPQGQPPW